MKKVLVCLLTCLMIFTLVACGNKNNGIELPKENKGNPIYKLLDEGYEIRANMVSDSKVLTAFFAKGDSYLIVTANLDDDTHNKMMNAGSESDYYAALTSIKEVETKDCSDEAISQTELDKYVGKTIGDFLHSNSEYKYNFGYSSKESNRSYFDLVKDNTYIMVEVDKYYDDDTIDKMTASEYEQLVISKIYVASLPSMSLTLVDTTPAIVEAEVSDEIKSSPCYELFANNYVITSFRTNSSMDKLEVLVTNYITNKYAYITAPVTEEQFIQFVESISGASDYELQMQLYICSLSGAKVSDVTDKVPTAELKNYVGKTLGDLENDGYKLLYGYGDNEQTCIVYANDKYEITVYINKAYKEEEITNIPDDERKALVIDSIYFSTFADGYIK